MITGFHLLGFWHWQ